MPKQLKTYELYKKSKFVKIATLPEICEITGFSTSYAYQCVSSSAERHRSSEWNIYPIKEMHIEFDNGSEVTIKDPANLAEKLNIERYKLLTEIKRRVNKAGWPIKKALTKVIKKRKNWDDIVFFMYKGEEPIADGTIYELSEQTGYSITYLKSIANGVIINKGDLAVQLVEIDDE